MSSNFPQGNLPNIEYYDDQLWQEHHYGIIKHHPQARSGAKNTAHHQKSQNNKHDEHDVDDVITSSDYPPHGFDDDFVDEMHQHYSHSHEDHNTDSHTSFPSSSSSNNAGMGRNRDIGARSGHRGDIYGVKDSGDRLKTRGRETLIGLHTKDKVFRPQVNLFQEDSRLLSLNDGNAQDCQNACSNLQWQCATSCDCIEQSERCDKEPQCEDGSDEFNCETVSDMMSKVQKECEQTGLRVMCPKTYHCINKEWLCDGDNDCDDYSDETHCGARTNCTEDQFECQNGFCIPRQWVCDGENDCKDLSDEDQCNRTG